MKRKPQPPVSVPVCVYWAWRGAIETACNPPVALYRADGAGPAWSVVFEFPRPPAETDSPSFARLRTAAGAAPLDYIRRGRVFSFSERRRRVAHVIVLEDVAGPARRGVGPGALRVGSMPTGPDPRLPTSWPAFPITVRWVDGRTETYEDFRNLELNVGFFDSRNAELVVSVTDGLGRRVHLSVQMLAALEFRLADEEPPSPSAQVRLRRATPPHRA